MSLANWYSKLAAGSAQLRVLCIGDSFTQGNRQEGAVTSNCWAQAWPKVLADTLTSMPGIAQVWMGDGGAFVVSGTVSDWDSRVALNGSWAGDTFFPSAGGLFHRAGDGTNNLTFSPSGSFDRLRVLFGKYSGSPQCTVNVDGGSSLGTLPQNDAVTGIGVAQYSVSLGTHVVNIDPPAADTFIHAIECWTSGTPSVSVCNAGWYGSTVGDWNNTGPTGALAAIAAYAPDLAIIKLGSNDALLGTAEGTFKTNLTAVINAALTAGADVLVVGNHYIDPTEVSEATQDIYYGWVEDVVTATGVSYLDLTSKTNWTSFAATDGAGYLVADDKHGTTTGYAALAELIRQVIDVLPPVVDSVTPDTFADAETGIVIAGENYGASQGDGRVVISPVNNINGETSVGVSRSGGGTGGTNPTAGTTLTIPTITANGRVWVAFTSRDHTSGTAQPTVGDNNGGAAWTQEQFSTDRKAQLWSKPYESGLSGKTITIAGCVGSCTAVSAVLDDVYQSSGYLTNYALQSNASGTESHAAVTPTNAGSAVLLAVFNYANDNAVSSVTAATTGAPGNTTGHLSTGGNDCATSLSVWNNHPASSSGSLSWAQTNGTTYSMAFAIRPRTPAGAAVEQTVTAWADDEITFTADQDTLPIGVNLYLFVENDDGASNASGFVVQFEEDSAVELVVGSSFHGHAADAPSLTQANTLSVGEAAHAHLADAVALSPAFTLTVAGSAHAHAADGPELTQANILAPGDAAHGHHSDATDLTQENTLQVGDSAHAQASDAVALVQANALAVADSIHVHASDAPVLSQSQLLAVGDSVHAIITEALQLTQAHVLAIESAVHAHVADGIDLSTAGSLSVGSSAHGHHTDAVELVQAAILTVGDSAHTLVTASIALSQGITLAIENAIHAHVADEVVLTQSLLLAVASAVHLHAADEVDLTQATTIVVSDSVHAHIAQQINLLMPGGLPVPPGRTIVVQAKSRVIVIQPESRTIRVH